MTFEIGCHYELITGTYESACCKGAEWEIFLNAYCDYPQIGFYSKPPDSKMHLLQSCPCQEMSQHEICMKLVTLLYGSVSCQDTWVFANRL